MKIRKDLDMFTTCSKISTAANRLSKALINAGLEDYISDYDKDWLSKQDKIDKSFPGEFAINIQRYGEDDTWYCSLVYWEEETV